MAMNDNDIAKAGQALDEAQVTKIAGGDCTVGELLQTTSDLKQSYDNLVDFTSYVIDRILGK
jgi:hypothetical protein